MDASCVRIKDCKYEIKIETCVLLLVKLSLNVNLLNFCLNFYVTSPYQKTNSICNKNRMLWIYTFVSPQEQRHHQQGLVFCSVFRGSKGGERETRWFGLKKQLNSHIFGHKCQMFKCFTNSYVTIKAASMPLRLLTNMHTHTGTHTTPTTYL